MVELLGHAGSAQVLTVERLSPGARLSGRGADAVPFEGAANAAASSARNTVAISGRIA